MVTNHSQILMISGEPCGHKQTSQFSFENTREHKVHVKIGRCIWRYFLSVMRQILKYPPLVQHKT